jgi:hypothetical protein
MGYLVFGMAVAGALLVALPFVVGEFRRSPAAPVVPGRLEQLETLLALRDALADNAPAVEAIDKVLVPAVVARATQ